MYEILHEKAPEDELSFYLSYAEKGMRILEPLCGSGRFLLPFLERGFEISGVDLSEEMLAALKAKAPRAKAVRADLLAYQTEEAFDYIFIPSGSISLFTDISVCKRILRKMAELLKPGGKFVFAVEGTGARCRDDEEYKTSVSVRTKEGLDLVLKTKNRYDPETQTQFSPGIYELYDGERLLQSERMDFQTHLYAPGEMDGYLLEAGFGNILVYDSFQKTTPGAGPAETLLYACGV